MGNRSANSSILGFEYQLVESLRAILDKQIKRQNTTFVVEGAEDLDSISPEITELYQYKYYRETHVSPGTFQKATAYLFSHWKKHQNENFRYKLFISAQNSLTTPTVSELSQILSMTNATKILQKEQESVIDATQSTVLYTESELKSFLSKYEIKMVPTFDVEITNVQSQISKIYKTQNDLASKLYLPLMLVKIHDIAIQKNVESRTIQVNDFIQSIESDSKDVKKIIRFHYEDVEKTIRNLKRYLKETYSFNTCRYNLILQFGEKWNHADLISLIKYLVPRFVSQGRKTQNQPLTFAIKLNSLEMVKFKKDLMHETKNNDIKYLFNDGYETFDFSTSFFSSCPIFRTNKPNTRYLDDISFNYRLCTLDNCNTALSELTMKEPFVFCFDTAFLENKADIPYLQLENFDKEDVQTLIGGLAK